MTGTQFLALEVKGPEGASAITQSLIAGETNVMVPVRSQRIVTSAAIKKEDVTISAIIMSVPTHASVALVTKCEKATSDDVTVSFAYFLFNLATSLIIKLEIIKDW